MRTAILFIVAFVIGYYISLLFSHPEKKKHKLPHIKFKNIEFLPNIKIHWKHRTYHLHHWLVLSAFLAVGVVVYEGIVRSPLVNGLTIGTILQGLRYKDRFRFRHPRFPIDKP